MDIVNLAGTQKYNALGIFQRVIFIQYFFLDSSKNLVRIKKAWCLSNYNWITSNKIKIKVKIKINII